MAFGESRNRQNRPVLSEINMVPLIDVMLVLLVIFIVTAPLLSHSVRVELPMAASSAIEMPPGKIDLAIGADGALYCDGSAVDRAALQGLFAEAGRKTPVPEVHIHADKHAEYQYVAEVMADASRAGLTKIGFVTLPGKAGIAE
ncbi:MAG: biopolymer transporter ExbD [Oxalobacter sp.]|nr:biopolymer transporter ExbD [Oxalobacter sp.]